MLAIVLISTVWAVRLAGSVPDPMAVHFDANFVADGFQSPTTNIVMLSGFSLLTIAGFAVVARLGMWHGPAGRIIAGTAGASVTLLSGLQVDLFRRQQGLSDATEATLPPSALGFALLVALGVGLVMGAITQPVPQPQTSSSTGISEVATPSAPTDEVVDQAVWQRSEPMHSGVRAVVGCATVVSVVFVVVMPNWATILTGLVTLLAVAMTWGWRFRIDARGFHYSSYLGFPRAVIEHDSIASVELVHVNAATWGGWGWRLNSSGTGLITQSGPGLRLTRTDGRILEITSDDAANAEKVLARYSSTI